jgi:hypothetical protein
MSERNDGNPNGDRRLAREESRVGRDRTPTEIPKQKNQPISSLTASYKLGKPQRPLIQHDNGFLDKFSPRAPNLEDYAKLAKWKAMLEGGEALRPDLTDALGAYRHFLEGKGKPRQFSYERYVMGDISGKTTLRNAILDIQKGAMNLWTKMLKGQNLSSFQLTGSAISCGGSSPLFPYPATENWQKAIGGHVIWLIGTVTVTKNRNDLPQFYMTMTLHAEDRYNFNPGAADIATGIPDADNGIFEITGLAHQYDHFSELTRKVQWVGVKSVTNFSTSSTNQRQRQPQDNKRIRNQI